MLQEKYTKYEIARIIGARALQIAMDAPILLKLSEEELKAIDYNALKIAEKEFYTGVLPITISRPTPLKKKEKLTSIKEESISDEELIAKAQEAEREIIEEAKEAGFMNDADDEDIEDIQTDFTEE